MASPSASLPRGSFDDVYRANGSGVLSSSASSASLAGVGGVGAGSVVGASAGGGDEFDADMSDDANDTAMSDTSSLDIDDSDLAAIDVMDDFLLQGAADAQRLARPASFHGALTADNHDHSHSHSHSHSLSLSHSHALLSPPSRHLHALARTASLGAYMPSHIDLSPRKRKRAAMLLHCHFAPAMTKQLARTTPHPLLVRMDREADDQMNGKSRLSDHHYHHHHRHDDGDRRRAPATDRFARVEWAHAESFHDDRDGVHLVAVRNQVVGTQLRVLANDPFQLTTDHANWFLAHGHAPRCRVQVETAYVPQSMQIQVLMVGYVSNEMNDRVMETLERRTASEALALEHAVYVRVRVGDAVGEGTYEIPVRLYTQHAGFTDEELSWATTIQVRVANVVLPPPSQWAFHLDLWQHHSSIARGHGGVPLWSDAHFALIDRYFASLAELGQKCLTVVVSEMPWAGQQCYNETTYPSALYEHAVLDVYEDAKGVLSVDFQHFDRLLALADKHHMAAEIEVFGLFSIWKDAANGFGSPVASSLAAGGGSTSEHASSASTTTSSPASASPPADNHKPLKSCETDRPLDSWRIRCVHRTTQRVRYLRSMAEIERFVTLIHDHCVRRQLADRVRVCADEPSDLVAFYAQMAFLERAAPRFKVKVALNHLDFLQHAPPQVVDVVPLLPLVCADLDVTHRWARHVREVQQGRFCWYVCCGPGYPNQFVSSPLVEGELVGFLTHFLGLDGFLRWNFCLWPAKPWENLKWRSPMWKVGDMYFVLPGQDGFPVETLRYESMRFAVQSFELLRLAKQELSEPEFARLQDDVAALIWRSPGHAQFGKYLEQAREPEDLYSLDANDYERARRLLIDALAVAASLDPKNAPVAEAPAATGSSSPSRPTSPRTGS